MNIDWNYNEDSTYFNPDEFFKSAIWSEELGVIKNSTNVVEGLESK